jgi:hypothetical protein
MGPAVAEGIGAGVDDVLGGVEIGLANFEVNHVPALGFEGAGANEDFEGGFGAETLHSGGEPVGHV